MSRITRIIIIIIINFLLSLFSQLFHYHYHHDPLLILPGTFQPQRVGGGWRRPDTRRENMAIGIVGKLSDGKLIYPWKVVMFHSFLYVFWRVKCLICLFQTQTQWYHWYHHEILWLPSCACCFLEHTIVGDVRTASANQQFHQRCRDSRWFTFTSPVWSIVSLVINVVICCDVCVRGVHVHLRTKMLLKPTPFLSTWPSLQPKTTTWLKT